MLWNVSMVKHNKSFLYLILKIEYTSTCNTRKYIQNLKITKPLRLLLGSWQVNTKFGNNYYSKIGW